MVPVAVPILLVALLSVPVGSGPRQEAVQPVRAVLFHSPACPHCRTVLARDIPPLEARWGRALEVLRVDVTLPAGADLYRSAVTSLRIPEDRLGVPTLVVGRQVMVGSDEIPARLPGLVADAMEEGGTDWPPLDGLPAYLSSASRRGPERQEGTAAGDARASPDGLLLAWGVLGIVALVLLRGGRWSIATGSWQRLGVIRPTPAVGTSAAAFLLLGMGTSGYLSATALSASDAVCGPVGDCAAVHASAFSRLLGVPVSVLGLGFYLILAALWYLALRDGRGTPWLVILAFLGVAFSGYLTAMEIFVLRAVCLWCLGSALAAAALLWLLMSSIRPVGD